MDINFEKKLQVKDKQASISSIRLTINVSKAKINEDEMQFEQH